TKQIRRCGGKDSLGFARLSVQTINVRRILIQDIDISIRPDNHCLVIGDGGALVKILYKCGGFIVLEDPSAVHDQEAGTGTVLEPLQSEHLSRLSPYAEARTVA